MRRITDFFLGVMESSVKVVEGLMNYHENLDYYGYSIPQSRHLDDHSELLEALRRWVGGRYEFMEWLGDTRHKMVGGKDILYLIDNYEKRFRDLSTFHERPSCNIGCDSVCCHFPSNGRLHGLLIESSKLDRIRDMLEKEGENPEDFIERVGWDEIPEDEKAEVARYYNMADYLVREGTSEAVYQTALDGSRRLHWNRLHNAPKRLDGMRLWMDPHSYACKFLDRNNLCIMHRLSGLAGEDLCLEACRDFICTLGYVINTLLCMKVLESDDIENKKIFGLYQTAEVGLLSLYDDVEGESKLEIVVFEWETALKSLIYACLMDERDLSSKIREVEKAERDYSQGVRRIRDRLYPRKKAA
jgi:hypothetical protein